MSVKAAAYITSLDPHETDSTLFQVNVRYVQFDEVNPQSGNVVMPEVSKDIIGFDNAVKQAVKDYLSIGALDSVLLIGGGLV